MGWKLIIYIGVENEGLSPKPPLLYVCIKCYFSSLQHIDYNVDLDSYGYNGNKS
jgi:hypothetical protein